MSNNYNLEEINIDELAGQIQEGNTIPIIGYELLRLKIGQKEISILEFLAYEYLRLNFRDIDLRALDFDPDDFDTTATGTARTAIFKQRSDIPIDTIVKIFNNKSITRTGIELMHYLYYKIQKKLGSSKADGYKSGISGVIKKYRSSGIIPQLHESLVYLSVIKHFNFYINATVFKSLQISLENCRVDRAGDLKVFGYNPISIYQKFEIPDKPRNFKRIDDIIKGQTLYNLFADHEKYFVLTEADYIELLYDLSINDKNAYSDFQYLLSNANLLFIGCNFRDWFLRFFLRFCSDSKKDFEERTKRSLTVDDYEKDPNLIFFMNNNSIKTSSLAVGDFVKKLYENFKAESQVADTIHKNYVFISYCWDDGDIAFNIKNQLAGYFSDTINYSAIWEPENRQAVEGGFWYDKVQMKPNITIDAQIGDAINKCSVLIPIVTAGTQKIENRQRYFWKEWDFAVKNGTKIFPIWVGKVDGEMLMPDCRVDVEGGVRSKILRQGIPGAVITEEKAKQPAPLSEDDIKNILAIQFQERLNKPDANG